jgi:hypothetical protein
VVDGGDAVGVDGDEADFVFFAELEVGGELGDGGGFADAGGAMRATTWGPVDLVRVMGPEVAKRCSRCSRIFSRRNCGWLKCSGRSWR